MPSWMPSIFSARKSPFQPDTSRITQPSFLPPQAQHFVSAVCERTPRRMKKPVNFRDLNAAHQGWKGKGSNPSDPSVHKILHLAQRYCGWALEQGDNPKLQRNLLRANCIWGEMSQVLKTQEAAPSEVPATAAPRPTALRRVQKAATAAVKSFRTEYGPPKPGSFKEVKQAWRKFEHELAIAPQAFDVPKAQTVLRLIRDYLAKHDKACHDELTRRECNSLKHLDVEIEDMIERHAQRRALGIDVACIRRHSPDLEERTAERQKHAISLIMLSPGRNLAIDGTSERMVSLPDGTPLYRFIPMPTRAAADRRDVGPQHAVLASILHRKLIEDIGMNLRFPCATAAMVEGVPGVLVDHLAQPTPKDLSQVSALDLQGAVVAQWVLGRPKANWNDMAVGQSGHPRPRDLPLAAPSPRTVAQQALSKQAGDRSALSDLFFDPETGDPIPGLHEAVDAELAKRIVQLDLDALTKRMLLAQDIVDMRTLMNGRRAGQEARHYVASHRDAVDRLLEPLRALQTALKAGPGLPLAMILVDAAEELSHSRYA